MLVGMLVWVWGCARADGPAVVDVGEAPAAKSAEPEPAPVAASVTSSGSAAAPSPEPAPLAGSCKARGLPEMEPCPGGGQGSGIVLADVNLSEALSEIEELQFCCGSGPVTRGEGTEPCFNKLQHARLCKDPKGEAAAQARISAYARAFGEPCKEKGFRAKFFGWGRYQQICAERGYP